MQDISDILEDLNRSHDLAGGNYNDGRSSGQADLQDLTRAWVNERGTTELLPYMRSASTDISPF
jgi:GINS complex subunit 4